MSVGFMSVNSSMINNGNAYKQVTSMQTDNVGSRRISTNRGETSDGNIRSSSFKRLQQQRAAAEFNMNIQNTSVEQSNGNIAYPGAYGNTSRTDTNN